ncbi:uncharacterized protein LOC142901564 [Nelusetta ayraudi]|uniref:uncharacterized protein LOC142901564 n=1 Tax=Nelusetta ayraudi TaxID=303726 RepID=UPI003F6E7D0C
MGNMDTAGLLRLVLVVLPLTMNQVLAQSDMNVAVGGDLVLELDPQPAQVKRVVWKHGANLLAEMTLGEFSYYGSFKGHTVLEDSGRLTVLSIQLTEGGEYSVEVNNVIQAKHYNVRVFEEVGRPTIRVTPLICGPGSENCTLVCDLDVAPSQDVSYEWQLAGEESRISGKELIINKTTQATNFTCWAKILVSQQPSESQKNPLIDTSKPPDTLNVAVGGDLVLELDPQPAQVKRVVWKHGANLLAEMTLGEFSYYGSFNGHTVLEDSGRLTVLSIQLTEGGEYSVEVNNVIQAKRYNVRVFEDVGRPTIRVTRRPGSLGRS